MHIKICTERIPEDITAPFKQLVEMENQKLISEKKEQDKITHSIFTPLDKVDQQKELTTVRKVDLCGIMYWISQIHVVMLPLLKL